MYLCTFSLDYECQCWILYRFVWMQYTLRETDLGIRLFLQAGAGPAVQIIPQTPTPNRWTFELLDCKDNLLPSRNHSHTCPLGKHVFDKVLLERY
jgi:hypothetical protein